MPGELLRRSKLLRIRFLLACLPVLAAGWLLLGAPAAQAQISPGPLSKAHQSLSGATQCTSCHVLRMGSAELKCLDCHTEIARRLREHRGLHAAVVQDAAPGKECARCHSEHNGEDFQLIHWETPLASFDHRKTGYTLEGKHAALDCKRCHTAEHIAAEERSQIRMKDLARSWLGLSRDCVSCHKDPHSGHLGNNCTQCHNFTDWKAGAQFDHSKTRFPLTGLHGRVACAKCHVTGGPEGKAQYTGLAFAACADCHKDPHRGAFPQACAACHTTEGWRQVRLGQNFDHAKTAYPLLGKHQEVGCVKCHGGADFHKPLAHTLCADCHKPDPHQGQFRERSGGGDCAGCHTVSGFKPSTFGVKEHATSHYPLAGKHAEVTCAKCHLPAGAATLYKIKFERCLDCHSDVHRGQFAAAPYLGKCESCHTVEGFHPAKFTLAQHAKTRFPLEGAHPAVICKDCHREELINGERTARYRFEDRSCTACHKDPHGGKFRSWMERVRSDGTRAGCRACHSLQSWRDAAGFDHSTTKFALTGAHRGVACSGCHKPSGAEAAARELAFGTAPTVCSECHADPHGGQFARGGKATDCSGCHSTAKWVPSRFDHDRNTVFPLKGAHERVSCASCHKLVEEKDGKNVLLYKPTPKACVECHGDREFPN
jgi:NAD-dependent dihydropyrimidine dehydrogenase PreA subunit